MSTRGPNWEFGIEELAPGSAEALRNAMDDALLAFAMANARPGRTHLSPVKVYSGIACILLHRIYVMGASAQFFTAETFGPGIAKAAAFIAKQAGEAEVMR